MAGRGSPVGLAVDWTGRSICEKSRMLSIFYRRGTKDILLVLFTQIPLYTPVQNPQPQDAIVAKIT